MFHTDITVMEQKFFNSLTPKTQNLKSQTFSDGRANKGSTKVMRWLNKKQSTEYFLYFKTFIKICGSTVNYVFSTLCSRICMVHSLQQWCEG